MGRGTWFLGLSPNALSLSFASLTNSLSGEMVATLLPLFLTHHIKVSNTTIGWLEGSTLLIAIFIKFIVAVIVDRYSCHKLLTVLGYLLAALCRIALLWSTNISFLFFTRWVDKVAKALRSPRDVLLAVSVPHATRAKSYSIHHSSQTLGAALSLVLALVIMHSHVSSGDVGSLYQTIMLVSAPLGLASFLIVLIFTQTREEAQQELLDYQAATPPPGRNEVSPTLGGVQEHLPSFFYTLLPPPNPYPTPSSSLNKVDQSNIIIFFLHQIFGEKVCSAGLYDPEEVHTTIMGPTVESQSLHQTMFFDEESPLLPRGDAGSILPREQPRGPVSLAQMASHCWDVFKSSLYPTPDDLLPISRRERLHTRFRRRHHATFGMLEDQGSFQQEPHPSPHSLLKEIEELQQDATRSGSNVLHMNAVYSVVLLLCFSQMFAVSHTFLILLAGQNIEIRQIVVAILLYNLVYSLFTAPSGAVADILKATFPFGGVYTVAAGFLLRMCSFCYLALNLSAQNTSHDRDIANVKTNMSTIVISYVLFAITASLAEGTIKAFLVDVLFQSSTECQPNLESSSDRRKSAARNSNLSTMFAMYDSCTAVAELFGSVISGAFLDKNMLTQWFLFNASGSFISCLGLLFWRAAVVYNWAPSILSSTSRLSPTPSARSLGPPPGIHHGTLHGLLFDRTEQKATLPYEVIPILSETIIVHAALIIPCHPPVAYTSTNTFLDEAFFASSLQPQEDQLLAVVGEVAIPVDVLVRQLGRTPLQIDKERLAQSATRCAKLVCFFFKCFPTPRFSESLHVSLILLDAHFRTHSHIRSSTHNTLAQHNTTHSQVQHSILPPHSLCTFARLCTLSFNAKRWLNNPRKHCLCPACAQPNPQPHLVLRIDQPDFPTKRHSLL